MNALINQQRSLGVDSPSNEAFHTNIAVTITTHDDYNHLNSPEEPWHLSKGAAR